MALTKPFALDELLARVHAVLRRTKRPIDQLRLGNTVIDFRRLEASCGAKRVELTDREFEILHCLAARAGHVVRRVARDAYVDSRSVRAACGLVPCSASAVATGLPLWNDELG